MEETLMSFAIPALWVLWFAFWCYAARGVKPAQRRESLASRLSHGVPLMIGALLIARPSIPGWLGQPFWPRSWSLYGIAVGLTAAGLGYAVWARYVLGRNWSGTVTLKEGHELIRSGPYRWIRHPIYTGLLLGFVGSALARDEWRGIVAVVVVAAAFWRKLRIEERWMRELFGARYDDYCRHSWALVPWVL
jgi:protein-S-isoprenylcysteine O-methyltransferase Ste14